MHPLTLYNRGNLFCPGNVALVSDSARFVGEAFTTLGPYAPNMLRCCFPSRHIDYSPMRSASFPLQEIMDLYILAHTTEVVTTVGGFADLATVFTKFGRSSKVRPLLVTHGAAAATEESRREEVSRQLESIFKCEDVGALAIAD